MLPVDDKTTLARLFHMNSGPRAAGDAFPYEVHYKEVGGAAPLPAPSLEAGVGRALRARQSCRRFAGRPMELSTLADLAAAAYGLTALRVDSGEPRFHARTVPSAGALYPLEVYLVAEKIEGLADGIYHYHVRDHALEVVRAGSAMRSLAECLIGQGYVAGANLVVVFSAIFDRTTKKYGPRGYRYILFEAGHAAQNVCLLAAERGLGTLCMGGFYDLALNHLVGLDGDQETALYCVAVGSTERDGAGGPDELRSDDYRRDSPAEGSASCAGK